MSLIQRIGHTAFVTSDMEKSLHFYCDVLGLTKAFEIHDEAGNPWIVYIQVTEFQFVELFYGGKAPTTDNTWQTGYNHMCFEVDDIEATASHLRASGITLDVEPKQGLDLNYQCWVRDPDGNRIEFMQLHPDSPHVKSQSAFRRV
jgi:catechol 2,3-dioxygenase-like lactoylglutathione lyase family enzyme